MTTFVYIPHRDECIPDHANQASFAAALVLTVSSQSRFRTPEISIIACIAQGVHNLGHKPKCLALDDAVLYEGLSGGV